MSGSDREDRSEGPKASSSEKAMGSEDSGSITHIRQNSVIHIVFAQPGGFMFSDRLQLPTTPVFFGSCRGSTDLRRLIHSFC